MSKEIKKSDKSLEGEKPVVRKLIALKKGGLMDLEEWCKIPHEGTSKTEDADFEVIEPKQIENKQP